MKYNITLNKNQLKTLYSALEVLSRLHSGQWDMVFNHIFRYIFSKNHVYTNYFKKMDKKLSTEDLKKLLKKHRTSYQGTFYELINVLKELLLDLRPNEGFGVRSKEVDSEMDTAFDMLQVIRTHLGDRRKPHQFDAANSLLQISEIKKCKKRSKK